MKKGLLLIGILISFLYIQACGINNRGADPGLENGVSAKFTAHDERRDSFGFWNQQRDRKNPIANMVTRDERPGRGMNGILDHRPPEMNRRVSRFEATNRKQEIGSNPKAFANKPTHIDKNLTKQLTLELLQIDMVRDVRIISYQNKLLIAVDSETDNLKGLKDEINQFVTNKYPNKEVIIVTDHHAVDRIRMLNDGLLDEETNRESRDDFFENRTGPIVGQYK